MPWDDIIRLTGINDGDLAMLIPPHADNLRQIMSLRESHPETAALAARSREAILREPVVFEWEKIKDPGKAPFLHHNRSKSKPPT